MIVVETYLLASLAKKRENVWTKDNSKMTHTVYAPRYPAEKQEWWWAYLVMVNPKREKSTERLITEPINVTNLGTQRFLFNTL